MFVCATLNSEFEPHLDRGAALDCDGQTPECAQTPGLQFCLFWGSWISVKISKNAGWLQAQRNELNAKVRMLREELQHLQEQCSYVGEVIKCIDQCHSFKNSVIFCYRWWSPWTRRRCWLRSTQRANSSSMWTRTSTSTTSPLTAGKAKSNLNLKLIVPKISLSGWRWGTTVTPCIRFCQTRWWIIFSVPV